MTQPPQLLPAHPLENYLEGWPVPDRDRILALSIGVAEELERWADGYPFMRRVRILPLAMSVTAAAPFSDVDALVATARVSLWVFALDDLFDEGGLSIQELQARARRFKAIVSGKSTPSASDGMEEALQELRQGLACYPLFQALGNQWTAAVQGTIDGMIQEDRWRQRYRSEGAAMLPSYEAYLANGRYSIGGPPHIWSAFITVNDSSTPDHLETLHAMERLASTCIRLANDLQSHAKEVVEGKFNALEILSHTLNGSVRGRAEYGVSKEQAKRYAIKRVQADIAAGLHRLAELRAATCSNTGQPEAAVANIARFVCRFYTQHDFHTFTDAIYNVG